MLRDAFIIHDGFLNTLYPWSSSSYHARLAAHDAAVFFIVVENVAGQTGTITLQVEHSGDAVNWANKNGTAEINAVNLTGPDVVAVGYDNGALPTMQHARLRITTTAIPEKLHVCAYVALRDIDPPHAPPTMDDRAPKRPPIDPADVADFKQQKQEHEAEDKSGPTEQGSRSGRGGDGDY